MKRSQVSWAIAEVLDRTAGPEGGPRSDLDRDLRRLVDIDRRLGLELQEKGQGLHFAFLEALPEGSGHEIDYSGYDAFALTLGVQLLDGGFPQAKVIGFMRSIHKPLRHEHERILRIEPQRLLDHEPIAGLEREIARGQLVRDPDNMIYLVVETRLTEAMAISGGALRYARSRTPEDPAIANICRGGKALLAFVAQVAASQSPALVLELVNLAFQLDRLLQEAPVLKRGRPGGAVGRTSRVSAR